MIWRGAIRAHPRAPGRALAVRVGWGYREPVTAAGPAEGGALATARYM